MDAGGGDRMNRNDELERAREAEREWLRKMIKEYNIELPDPPEPTPEELAHRHKVAEAIRRLREEIGPVDMTMEELFGDDEDDDD
jgi:hypothetical protein